MEEGFVKITEETPTSVLKIMLFDNPYLSYKEKAKVIEYESEMAATNKYINNLTDEQMLTVSAELDEKGKAIFGNQAQREAEVRVRLRKIDRYNDYLNKLTEWNRLKNGAKNRIEYHDKMFSVIKNTLYDTLERERIKLRLESRLEEVKELVE